MYIKAWNAGKILLPMVGKDILLHIFFSLLLQAYFFLYTYDLNIKHIFLNPIIHSNINSMCIAILLCFCDKLFIKLTKPLTNCFRQLIIQYPQMSSDIQLLFVFCFFLSCVSFLIILATYCWYNFIKLSLLFLFKLFF